MITNHKLQITKQNRSLTERRARICAAVLMGTMGIMGVMAQSGTPASPGTSGLPGTSGSPVTNSVLPPTTIFETPTPTSPTGNGILDQAKLFLSQPDRGLGTWTTTNGVAKTFDLSIGACFENNVNADGIINGDYAIYKRVTIDGFARIWNSSETIKSVGVGPGFELPIGDLKIGAYLDGVYRFDDHCVAVEPALALKNGVGKNAYLGLRLATDFEFSKHGSGQKPYVATFFGINF